ncbi:MAG: hypothetical protein LBT43_06090 [Prevotella sp.]|nr:hypothetical protein [Prevotella sp.]
MNKIYSFIAIVLLCISCSKQSEYERVITEALEVTNGTRTDLQIKYSKLEVSDVSVADSIAILKERFETERAKKIQSIEQSIKRIEESLAEHRGKLENSKSSTDELISRILIKDNERFLSNDKDRLEEAKNWKPDYLNRYDSRNPSEVIAKKASATLSFFNPKLQTRQEMSPLFILSPDGKKVIDVSKSN